MTAPPDARVTGPAAAEIAGGRAGRPRSRDRAAPARPRLVALDAFRGLTIAAMILVNSPGGARHGYGLLRHARWNGWQAADLIFPAFLFIAGVAIPLSFAGQLEAGADRRGLRAKILARTRVIFGLGLLLNALPYFDWDVLRIPGVLQRIALCYGAAALAALFLDIGGQVLLAAALLALYWALITLVPVPGIGAGVLQPGDDLGAFIDRTLMGHHLLHGTWDPEGLLGTLPAIATTLVGVLAGQWLGRARTAWRALAGLIGGGVAGVALGQLMAVWLPINKSLWTSSFAVFAAGIALLSFAACFWLSEIRGSRRWATPFVIYGTNPILAYGLSSLVTKLLQLVRIPAGAGTSITAQAFIFSRVFAPLAPLPAARLLYALAYTLLWLGVTALLYRRGVFVKI